MTLKQKGEELRAALKHYDVDEEMLDHAVNMAQLAAMTGVIPEVFRPSRDELRKIFQMGLLALNRPTFARMMKV